MKVNLESTSRIVNVDGVPARIWEGTTEGGAPCIALITRVTPGASDAIEEFEAELIHTRTPSEDAMAIPLHLVL